MIAIVEKENREDYVAVQYVVEDKWELHISKNQESTDDPVWTMHRKTPEGEMILLKGKRRIFEASKEKHQKLYWLIIEDFRDESS